MYLIRHDAVDMSGICYGQTDVPTIEHYNHSASRLKDKLPQTIEKVVSSPLSRCLLLSQQLFKDQELLVDPRIQEVNFGQWENTAWHDIPKHNIDTWSKTPTHFQFPEGEHLSDFYQRVLSFWDEYQHQSGTLCLVTHAGVIRALLAIVHDTPWPDCLQVPVPYLGVFHLTKDSFYPLS
ncbi:histidine phosphatase family protein [Reinekea marina]|uniref:Histidine phosphatase family protein n=1 Tax=Reinekea marina TaxID=1310421 RepID=A0ABV7WSW7_9GAMM|nr:histidine phosphatase family protein [Reinekea marina]MDN3649079.1 histidine phosphatase family protein [Reinekea marina]